MFTFYTKYFKLSSKCSQYRFKAFQNEIKILFVNLDIYKGFFILPELGQNLPAWLEFCKNSNDAQYKHEWTERAVTVNGQINEAKQLLAWAILGWVTIWQPQYFFSLAVRHIYQLSLNYGKTQMAWKFGLPLNAHAL